MTELLGSGLSFPLSVDRRGGIALATGEQDVDQAIEIILSTAPGERPMRPEFGCGVHDFVFDTIDAATAGRLETEVRRALERWETRIVVEEIDFDLAQMGDGRLLINIGYRIRSTNHKRNLVYPFYVIPDEETAERVGCPTSSSTIGASRTSSPRPACASTARAPSGRSTTSPTRASR